MMGFSVSVMALAATIPHIVSGHGYLVTPRSHNSLANLDGNESCPHCKNGGGKGTVVGNTSGNSWPWPYEDPTEQERHGMCGGEALSGEYERYGEIPAGNFFKSGEVIDVKVQINAHHKGHIELRICEVEPWSSASNTCPAGSFGTKVTQTCLNEHLLLRTETPGALSGTEVYGPDGVNAAVPNTCDANAMELGDAGQFDSCFPERFYLGDRRAIPRAGGNWFPEYQVKLPEDVTCDHCILQFVYVTSNSCSPPGYRDAIEDITATSSGICGSSPNLYPEEFWNCASVAIAPTDYDAVPTETVQSSCTEVYWSGGTVVTTSATNPTSTGVTTSATTVNTNPTSTGVTTSATTVNTNPTPSACSGAVKSVCKNNDNCTWVNGNPNNGGGCKDGSLFTRRGLRVA